MANNRAEVLANLLAKAEWEGGMAELLGSYGWRPDREEEKVFTAGELESLADFASAYSNLNSMVLGWEQECEEAGIELYE